jgi:Carbohydrate binding domain
LPSAHSTIISANFSYFNGDFVKIENNNIDDSHTAEIALLALHRTLLITGTLFHTKYFPGRSFKMHFSLPSLLLTSTALVSIVSAILAPAPAPQSASTFYDDSAAPDLDSTDVESTKTENVASKAQCTPTSYSTPRAFKLAAEPGPHCLYQTFIGAFETDPDRQEGVKKCKNKCTKNASCRGFSWYSDSATPDVGNCLIAAKLYDPDRVECDPSYTATYLGIYNVTNWTPWDPLIPNGGFESGCFKPWFFGDFTSDSSMRKTVVDCNQNVPGDCAPGGGKRYVRITGNGQNGSQRNYIDAYIGQKPGLTEGTTYKLSAQIRGDSGEFRFTYPVHTGVAIRANATPVWTSVETTFTGSNVGTFLIQMDAPEKANFAIDNVKIVAV